MHAQQEIDAIWRDAKDDKYGDNPDTIKPEIVVDDESEQVISINEKDGSARTVYRRKPVQEWELAPSVGESDEYE